MSYKVGKRVKPGRDWVVVGLVWTLVGILALLTSQCVSAWVNDNRVKRTVYQVCEYTRTTDATEDACRVAQDASRTEYLCKHNNPLPTNNCWVEDHQRED